MKAMHHDFSGFRYKPSSQPSSRPSFQPSKLPPPPKPVFINFVVLSTTLFITVALILTFARAWRKRSLKNTASQERFSFFNPNTTNIPPPRKILPFFQRLAPLELTANITWLQLFRRRLITDHSYCAVFCAAFDSFNEFLGSNIIGVQADKSCRVDREGLSLYEHGLVCIGKTVNIVLVVTLFVQLLYNDYGTCAQHSTYADCNAAGEAYTLAYPLCHWVSDFNSSARNITVSSSSATGHSSSANKTTTHHQMLHFVRDESACLPAKADSHFMAIVDLVMFTLLTTALLDKILRFLAAHAAVMPPLFQPREMQSPASHRHSSFRIAARVTPSWQDEKDDADSVQPFDATDGEHWRDLEAPVKGPPLREDHLDELQAAQSVKATVLRAARLKRLRETADYVPAELELWHMQQRWQSPEHPLRFNDWKPVKHVMVPSVHHPKRPPPDPGPQEKRRRTEFLRRRVKSWLFWLYDFADPYTTLHLLLHAFANERSLVIRKLVRARERADRVRNEILRVRASLVRAGLDESACERLLDEHILKRFMCEWICGYRRKVLESVLFHGKQIERQRIKRRRLQFFGYFFLPLYFATAIAYVLWSGVFTIGSDYVLRGDTAATRHWSYTVFSTPSVLWLSAVLLCLSQELVLGMGFARVFVKQVWIPLLARREFVALHSVLSLRARTILRRSSGLLLLFGSHSEAHSLLQHFHPVLRAARSFPELASCRLLLSLTDCDLPLLPREGGFMVSAFGDSELNVENPWYNEQHLWQPLDRRSPLCYDKWVFVASNAQIAATFCLALAAFYFKNAMALVFYGLLCLPEWLQHLLSEVVVLGGLNFFCMALYAGYAFLPSPGGALLAAVGALAVAAAVVGLLYKLLVYDRRMAALAEQARLREKRLKLLRQIDSEILRVKDRRSKLWVHSVAGGKH